VGYVITYELLNGLFPFSSFGIAKQPGKIDGIVGKRIFINKDQKYTKK
jgi:hypothetical protein